MDKADWYGIIAPFFAAMTLLVGVAAKYVRKLTKQLDSVKYTTEGTYKAVNGVKEGEPTIKIKVDQILEESIEAKLKAKEALERADIAVKNSEVIVEDVSEMKNSMKDLTGLVDGMLDYFTRLTRREDVITVKQGNNRSTDS